MNLQWLKVATSKLAIWWGLPKSIIKSYPEEKVRGPGLGELPKILGFPINIYAIAESIDFKLCTQFLWPIRPIIKSHSMDYGLSRSDWAEIKNCAAVQSLTVRVIGSHWVSYQELADNRCQRLVLSPPRRDDQMYQHIKGSWSLTVDGKRLAVVLQCRPGSIMFAKTDKQGTQMGCTYPIISRMTLFSSLLMKLE